ncbi:helicase/secretion neighborhood TadE-like protein [Frankia torreyi]|uniref:Helicase/secretion neighborhood TadE-like protein n=1 Tax=Frankia torreyi TaxID=1856 RepID=A0A0D8BK92_9ACTN|nr:MULTISPECIES: Rv3654c family TadE-like protein [Frankia]KJE24434.1 helicase/secretion neighborhood TadE-like protein [Frankia torreyi]KQC38394.1 helicase [Frankia sp. ACN1ag]KQM06302.1 helicase/secretion neighborhood TadE-like protein [Frankia sp. CpI1-P]
MTTDGRHPRPEGLAAPAATGEPRDDGSATVWLLAVLFALLSLAGLAFTVTVIGASRQRAATAADLAALAAAALPPVDEQAVCARAREISAANGARLVDCRIVADAVEIAVGVHLPAVIGRLGDLSVHARAGPWGGAAGAYLPTSQEANGQERAPAPS